MKTEIGEYVVGAYLKIIIGCDYVDYNVRPMEKGLKGLSEFDVIGVKLEKGKEEVFLCEVSTHLDGLVYGSNCQITFEKIVSKYKRQKDYRKKYIPDHFQVHYMFWSPVVLPKIKGMLEMEAKKSLNGLDFMINKKYLSVIEELKREAKKTTKTFGNPFFRALQILEHLRDK